MHSLRHRLAALGLNLTRSATLTWVRVVSVLEGCTINHHNHHIMCLQQLHRRRHHGHQQQHGYTHDDDDEDDENDDDDKDDDGDDDDASRVFEVEASLESTPMCLMALRTVDPTPTRNHKTAPAKLA